MPPEANGPFRSGGIDGKGIRFLQIKDGLSNTLLVGEKHVPFGKFGVGGWDCSMYNGANWFCSMRSAGYGFPIAQSINDPNWRFGSYHRYVCQFVFADGSVHTLSAGLDETTLACLADIADGQVLPPYE